MSKLIVTEFVSLDGVGEGPGGGEDFERAGWAMQIPRGDDGDKFKVDELMASDITLLGRKTYEGFAAAWPGRSDEAGFADKMNSMPKVVVSSTLTDPEWENSTVIDGSGDVPAEIAKLKEGDEEILVHGSLTLVQTLIENDLVDELRLMVFPLVIGTGKRVFGETSASKDWKLTDSKPVGPAGVVILTYVPA